MYGIPTSPSRCGDTHRYHGHRFWWSRPLVSHLVKPISFRAGKTQPWASNTLLGTKSLVSSDLLLAKGIAKLNKALLRRKRLYVVKGNIVDSSLNKITYNLIYAPKIKTKPREHSIGGFIRRSIYKPFNWLAESVDAKAYVDRRKEKTAKIRKRYRPKKLNRWLSRRMFRGAGRPIFAKKAVLAVANVTNNSAVFRNMRLFKLTPEYISQNEVFGHNTAYLAPVLSNKLIMAQRNIRCNNKSYKSKMHWREAWQFDKIKSRRFNSKRLSTVVSRMLHRRVKIRVLNLFSYLASKQAITFKSHQNHFWNFAYRRYRFQYKNYYDITNAFLAIGLVDHAEGFLLSILRLVLPLILKIRRFFKFLNAVIKNMPELQDKFSVFKMHIAGKLAGGTKRTKSHSIGYGTLPVQTLDIAASNNFLAYRHIYGEFGLKLIVCKNPTYKSPLMLA